MTLFQVLNTHRSAALVIGTSIASTATSATTTDSVGIIPLFFLGQSFASVVTRPGACHQSVQLKVHGEKL